MKITRKQHRYDEELAAKGQRRIFAVDISPCGRPIYRERIIDADQFLQPSVPWWKKSTKKRSRR